MVSSFYVVRQPTVTIRRSRDGPLYAGTIFELIVDVLFSYSNMDIVVDISWKQNSITQESIGSSTRTTVSAVSGSGDSYTASLTYSPITISDSGLITATITVSMKLSDVSMCAKTKVSDQEMLHIEGVTRVYLLNTVLKFLIFCQQIFQIHQ